MLGQYDRAVEVDVDPVPFIPLMTYLARGLRDEAMALTNTTRQLSAAHPHLTLMFGLLDAILGGRVDEGRAHLAQLSEYPAFTDPEGWYYWAQAAVLVEDHPTAMNFLRRAVTTGLSCPRGLETAPLLDPLRATPEFVQLVAHARRTHETAAAAFVKADGPRLLGLPRA